MGSSKFNVVFVRRQASNLSKTKPHVSRLTLHDGNENYCMLRLSFIFCFLLPLTLLAQNPIPPIGEWREHLNYQQTIQVVKGDKIYCATITNIFSVDSDGQTERYSKITGLNDIGVQCIAWDATTSQLVIAYTNSNIDLLGKTGNVKNIGDVKRSSIAGNKTIYHIYCSKGLAYVSTGLGIIVADLSKYEIKDTWFIGNNGAQVSVTAFAAGDAFFYAATADGLKSIPINNNNPSNFANWQNLSGSNGLPAGSTRNVVVTNNKVIAQKDDSLFINDVTGWKLLYVDTAWHINNITGAENKLLVSEHTLQGNARVLQLNTNGSTEKVISQNGVISSPQSAITDNGNIWVADLFGGLSVYKPAVERIIPNGPPGIATGEMIAGDDHIYAAAGSVNSSWNYQYNRNGVYSFQNDVWTSRGYYNTPVLDSVLDFITLAIDPVNKSLWAGSYGGGLVNFLPDGTPRIYKKNNSTLQPALGDPASYRVSGLAFDRNNNLWVSNYGAAQEVHVKKEDGSWKAFTVPFTHLENAVSQIIPDDNNQLWIVSPKDNGLFCFNYGQSIDVLSDDQWKYYRQGAGNGNLPGNTVLSILKDKNDFIWVGTDRGIGIIRCTADVFSPQGCEAILPVVQQDRFAGFLFKDESVQCMAVDGANRKWIGTKNGLWLISESGDKILYRFTSESSPLSGNDINHIAIDPSTGEVFISTNNGICSFRSTATEEQTTLSSVLVFPNPVPPGYNGTIAIRGLVKDALIKITELNGRLVYQTRSLGGQAIWNGYNYNGQKAASGVYLVIIRDDNNTEKIVTKIVIVSGAKTN